MDNFAPSISSAIGSVPQKYIWQTCIALHSMPRFLFAWMTSNYLLKRTAPVPQHRLLVRLCCLSECLENLGLLLLTVISSQEIFSLHKVGFATFLFFSFLHMCLFLYLLKYCGFKSQNQYERRSLQYKTTLCKLSFLFIGLAMYFYYRHNNHCEPYVYSFFCICEYFVVLLNMGFHMTAYYDFYTCVITVGPSSFGYQSLSLDSVSTA